MGLEEPQMRPERVDAIRALLHQRIRDEPRRRLQRKRRLVLIWGGIFIVGTGAAVTGGSVLLDSAKVSNTEIVHCYSSTVPNADGSYPGSSATTADHNGAGRVGDALALCTQMWQTGALNKGFDPTSTTNPPGAAPGKLQVCVMEDGSAVVIPGSTTDACRSIGLAPLDGP